MAAGGSGAAAPEATAAGEGGGIVPGSSRELAAGSCRAPAGAGSSRRSARPVPLAAQVKARWAGAAAGPLSSAESGAVGERVGSRDPAGRGTDGWRESCGGQLRAGRVTRGPQEELDNALLGKLAAEGKAGVGERAVVAEAALRVWCRLLFSALVPCCCGISSRCPHAAAVFLLCPHPFPLPSRCFPSWSFPCHSFPAPPSLLCHSLLPHPTFGHSLLPHPSPAPSPPLAFPAPRSSFPGQQLRMGQGGGVRLFGFSGSG